ncbi:hypothetical protein D3C71_188350 [compost metagenome]
MAFENHLSTACEYGEAGFHFEEGGCIAMALEIREALIGQKRDAVLAVDRSACHVFVLCEGMLLDHRGWNPMREVDIVDETVLLRLAVDWDVHSRLSSDRAWAIEIVEAAIEMAADIESSISDDCSLESFARVR